MIDYEIAKALMYDPNQEIADITQNLEVPHSYSPDINLHRVRYPTEHSVVDTAFQIEGNTLSHSTLVDKLPRNYLPDYTFLASQMPTRGLTIVTEPERGYVGVEGRNVLPSTRTGFQAMFLDTLSQNTHFVDNVHPIIKGKLQK